MSKPYIVMTTSGKHDDVDYVQINLFDDHQDAIKYCKKVSDKPNNYGDDDYVKYWTFAEIVVEGKRYEPSRYKNY